MPVIDASVYIALVNAHEREHAISWTWFEQIRVADEPVVAPVILLAEVAVALSLGIGDPTLAHRVVQQLARSEVIELIPVTQAMAEQAAGIAGEHRIRGCDAVYVALAQQLSDTLVTLDRQQLERGAALVTVRTPARSIAGPQAN
jgi:predicted nucleic acid-binding protein